MAFNKAYGLEKNAKLITVGPTSILDSRVGLTVYTKECGMGQFYLLTTQRFSMHCIKTCCSQMCRL